LESHYLTSLGTETTALVLTQRRCYWKFPFGAWRCLGARIHTNPCL